MAFVLDMGPNGLGIIRSLGRKGIPVVGIDYEPQNPGLYSRYCRRLLASNPTNQPQEFLKLLRDEQTKHSGMGVLFPTSDEYILFVSRFRRELSAHFRFAIPSEQILESVVNKRKFYELADRTDTLYPKTHYPGNLQDVERIKGKIEYPAFVKPYYSHVWARIFGNKGFVVNNPTELIERFKNVFDAKVKAMIQSIVIGSDSNIVQVYAYLTHEHKALATFVLRKLHQQPNHFGVGTCVESIHDSALVELALKFLRAIGYIGLGAVEFKKDNRDGKYKMLELNVRLGYQNILATQAGINFPLIQYLDLTNQSFENPKDYRGGIVWIDDIMDFLALYESNWKSSVPHWLISIWRGNCHSYFAADDVKPFMRALTTDISHLPSYLRRNRRAP